MPVTFKIFLPILAVAALSYTAKYAIADEALVAVASNFSETAQELRKAFESDTEHEITLVFASSGKLFAQISNGAPFDVFLSADRQRPQALARLELTEIDSHFVYAQGRIAMWRAERDPIDLERPLMSMAIANPKLAPYGLAAKQAFAAMNVWQSAPPKIVYGENVAQAFAMAATRNVDLAVVSLSLLRSKRHDFDGSEWIIPSEFYDPIEQEAALLERGSDNTAAVAFLAYLRSEDARKIIASFGYGTE